MRKLFGKYRGRVEDNADPQGLGRVQVSIPAALGAAARAWALPCVPYAEPGVGLLMLPPVGADVWVEFEEGDAGRPIWSGFFWNAPVAPPPAADDVTITTRGGHRLVLSDSRNEVSVSHPSGSTVKLDATGRVEVTGSSSIRVTAATVEVLAGMIKLDAGTVKASGLVQCDTLIATNVIDESSYPRRRGTSVGAAQPGESVARAKSALRADDADPLAGPWRAGSHRVPTTRLGEVMTDYARDGCASLRRATRADLLARTHAIDPPG